MERICILCKSYYFESGVSGYWDSIERCRKEYWETDVWEDTTESRRSNFLKAEKCSDYVHFREED